MGYKAIMQMRLKLYTFVNMHSADKIPRFCMAISLNARRAEQSNRISHYADMQIFLVIFMLPFWIKSRLLCRCVANTSHTTHI